MKDEPEIRTGRARLAARIAVVALVSLIGLLIALFLLLTDFGRGADRDIRTGLMEEPDWVLHLHRPDRLLTRAAEGGNALEILADPNWRWLLGLPEGAAAAAADPLAGDFIAGELLVAVSWPAEGARENERILAVSRPRSTALPRLLQLARSRFVFERILAPRLPLELAATWVEGTVLLATPGGTAELFVGSSRDLVVAASRLEDLQAYLRAQDEAPAADGAAPDLLRLSPRARSQLLPGLERVLGRELVAATRALGEARERELDIRIEPGAEGSSLSFALSAAPELGRAAAALRERIAVELPEATLRPLDETRLLQVGAETGAVTTLLLRIEKERREGEEAPSGERREELREVLRERGRELDDAGLERRLEETRIERLERVRREMACWRALLGRGFDLEVSRRGETLDFVLRLGVTP